MPTLEVGQRVLVNRIGARFSDPSVGDVVVFHPPAGAEADQRVRRRPAARRARSAPTPTKERADVNFIKRVVAGPGRPAGGPRRPRDPQRQAPEGAVHRALWRRRGVRSPARDPRSGRPLLHDGRQPWQLRRQPVLGTRSRESGSSAKPSPPTGLPSGSGSSRPAMRRGARRRRRSQRQPAVPLRPRARHALRGGRRRGGARLPGRAAGRRGGAVRLRAADAGRPAVAVGAQRLQAAHDGDARDAVPARAAGRDRAWPSPRAACGGSTSGGCTRPTWRR